MPLFWHTGVTAGKEVYYEAQFYGQQNHLEVHEIFRTVQTLEIPYYYLQSRISIHCNFNQVPLGYKSIFLQLLLDESSVSTFQLKTVVLDFFMYLQ